MSRGATGSVWQWQSAPEAGASGPQPSIARAMACLKATPGFAAGPLADPPIPTTRSMRRSIAEAG
jgi:hypothetical protein